MSNQPPTMRAYGRHMFICMHGDCAPAESGENLHRRFMALNKTHGLNKLKNPERVKCSLVDCMGVCSGGPIVAVYPDGIWYHHVDEAALERIYQEHILNDQPVTDLIFHRLYPAGDEPAYPPEVRGEAAAERGVIVEAAETVATVEAPAEPPTDAEAVRAQIRRARKKKGLVIVNTGTGKGKTTAALGVMTRAWGRNMKIGVMQFLKNENARFGEIRAGEKMGIDWLSSGDGWTWTSGDMDETEAKARHAWTIAQEKITSGAYDLLILDEFTYPLYYGWLNTEAVLGWLNEHKPPLLHLIITGRYAPQALINYADLVTEMREIKHPFKGQGIRAQAGIEY